MSTEGREPTLAHPLCTCVTRKLSFESLIGAYTPEWAGPVYKPTVTDESRAACPMNKTSKEA